MLRMVPSVPWAQTATLFGQGRVRVNRVLVETSGCGAKRSLGGRCLNRANFEPCARSVLPSPATERVLRARPDVRYEAQPGNHMLALSSSQVGPIADLSTSLERRRHLRHATSAPAPGDHPPGAFVYVVERGLGEDFGKRDTAGNLRTSGDQRREYEGVETASGPPTDSLDD